MSFGLLIVFEGLDASGKTYQAQKLAQYLTDTGHPSTVVPFPDRTTEIGKAIDKTLKSQIEISVELIHLLFSANRWELRPKIEELLRAGVNVICDRSFISGIVYTMSKQSCLRNTWIIMPEVGLHKPDIVFYLSSERFLAERIENRKKEKFENVELQERVRKCYDEFFKEYKGQWLAVSAEAQKENIFEILKNHIKVIFKNKRTENRTTIEQLQEEDFGRLMLNRK